MLKLVKLLNFKVFGYGIKISIFPGRREVKSIVPRALAMVATGPGATASSHRVTSPMFHIGDSIALDL